VGPSVGASVAVMPNSARPMGRLFNGSLRVTSVIAIGIITPPVKPCAARNTIMLSRLQAMPHKVLKIRNSATLVIR
jgi:hypothetical protein